MLSSAHLRVNYEGDSAHSHNWVRHGGQAFGCGLLACFRVWARFGLCAKSAHPRISPVSLYFNSQTIYGGSHISHISPWSHQSYLVYMYTKDDVRRARAGLAERVGCMQRRVAADSQQQPFVKARKR